MNRIVVLFTFVPAAKHGLKHTLSMAFGSPSLPLAVILVFGAVSIAWPDDGGKVVRRCGWRH
jgi:hypothetical protein